MFSSLKAASGKLFSKMIPVKHIFVIGDPKREPDRIQYLQSEFSKQGLEEYVSYFQPTYKDTLSSQELQQVGESLHGRPLKRSEISIFLNYIYLLESIKQSYSEGYFAIFESDVRFEQSLQTYLQIFSDFLQNASPDGCSIGSGCDCIDDAVNTDDMNFQIYPKRLVRCMDSYIFSYNGICSFLDYFLNNNKIINEPIDNYFQTFLEKNPDFSHFWVWPSVTLQGSQYGYYKSSIQDDAV
jgi:hypothetical protein